jgi:hypothetical protein
MQGQGPSTDMSNGISFSLFPGDEGDIPIYQPNGNWKLLLYAEGCSGNIASSTNSPVCVNTPNDVMQVRGQNGNVIASVPETGSGTRTFIPTTNIDRPLPSPQQLGHNEPVALKLRFLSAYPDGKITLEHWGPQGLKNRYEWRGTGIIDEPSPLVVVEGPNEFLRVPQGVSQVGWSTVAIRGALA